MIVSSSDVLGLRLGVIATEIRFINGWRMRQIPASVLRKLAVVSNSAYLLSFLLRMFALGVAPRNHGEEAYAVWVP
jgi:hypothetical protein